MNPYKTQSIQIVIEFELNIVSSKEIKDWISTIISKSEVKEPWMERILLACDLSDTEILMALHAIPVGHPNDDAWETMLRKPLTKSIMSKS